MLDFDANPDPGYYLNSLPKGYHPTRVEIVDKCEGHAAALGLSIGDQLLQYGDVVVDLKKMSLHDVMSGLREMALEAPTPTKWLCMPDEAQVAAAKALNDAEAAKVRPTALLSKEKWREVVESTKVYDILLR